MKTCLKCNNNFPIRVNIDGITRNLKNRKFCLNCSPFGLNNRKNLLLECVNTNEKICSKCKQNKPIEEFYLKTDRIHKYFAHCKSCSINKTKYYQNKTKKMAVDYLGGHCNLCGYDKYLGALEFHHKNPEEKDFNISEHKIISWEKLKPELDKCLLVCSNCHREIHGNVTQLPIS